MNLKLLWRMAKTTVAMTLIYGAVRILESDQALSVAFHRAVGELTLEMLAKNDPEAQAKPEVSKEPGE